MEGVAAIWRRVEIWDRTSEWSAGRFVLVFCFGLALGSLGGGDIWLESWFRRLVAWSLPLVDGLVLSFVILFLLFFIVLVEIVFAFGLLRLAKNWRLLRMGSAEGVI